MSPRYMKPFLLILLSVFGFLSCSDEEARDLQENNNKKTTMTMVLSATPPTFDTISTRGNATEWPDGARLYFKFTTEGQPISGCSTYSAATDEWTLNISGTIQESEDLKPCEVWYFEGADEYNDSGVQMSATSAIYHDSSAKYFCTNGCVSVTAHMQPIQARLRFSGIAGTVLKVSNWPYCTSFDAERWKMSDAATDTLCLTVGADGFTPYLYGTFENGEQWLKIETGGFLFLRPFSINLIENKKSYSIASPKDTIKSEKWLIQRSFSLNDSGKTVTFNMVKVDAGTFRMGRAGTNDVSTPVHTVSLTKNYYMGETEVTQALWYAVMGQSPTSDGNQWDSTRGLSEEHPAYYISYEDCQSFLSVLNSKMSSQLGSNELFRLPTEAEWEFAAKGGIKSKGYTYAGGNINNVAWYRDNSSSKTHPVKSKAANELYLYDMSGNVFEWCYDWYGDYTNSAQTDPIGPISGSYRVLRGGSWYNYADYCRVANRVYYTTTSRKYYIGFRLCLGAPIPELSVSSTSLSFGADASSKEITVYANGDYTFSTSSSWLTITPSSDKKILMVSASENTETSDRTATIILTLGSLTQTISITQESSHNREFSVTGNGKTVTFKMKKVEGGTFQMGSTNGYSDEQPVHSVTITKDYYMGETEVTNDLWFAVMGSTPSTKNTESNYPVETISYEDCQLFLSALNSILSSQLGTGEQFRFPTEAEWEFAARGGKKSNGYTYSGSNTIGDIAWYIDNSGSTTNPVKQKAANELALFDMSGNVWEWCYDAFESYGPSPLTDPKVEGSSNSNRVFRGGSWNYGTMYCRVSNRDSNTPTSRYYFYGLRLCLGAPIAE